MERSRRTQNKYDRIFLKGCFIVSPFDGCLPVNPRIDTFE
jgi:hypothetical protein